MASVLALLLCTGTLAGTTYAWFTDSASTGVNKIQAGNLDVELQMWSDTANEGKGGYINIVEPTYDENNKLINSPTVLFDSSTLWEPGHTEVVYLKIHNAGSLAINYNAVAKIIDETVGQSVKGNELKLSNYLQFGQVEGKEITSTADKYSTRDAAIEVVKSSAKPLSSEYSNTVYNMAAGDSDYLALVVYMPDSIGNEANYDSSYVDNSGNPIIPTISLGVEVVASQATVESDSYGTSYDADSGWGKFLYSYLGTNDITGSIRVPVTVSDDKTTTSAVKVANVSGTVAATVPAGVKVKDGATELTLDIKEIDTPDNVDNALAAYEISFDGIDESNDKEIEVVFKAPIGITGFKLYHNGVEMKENTDYTYDSASGAVKVKTTSFSPFVIAGQAATTVSDVDSLKTALSNEGDVSLVLTEDLNLSEAITISANSADTPRNVTINLGNKAISATIKDMNLIAVKKGVNLTIEGNGTVSDSINEDLIYAMFSVESGGSLTINGGKYDGHFALDTTGGSIIVNGGEFTTSGAIFAMQKSPSKIVVNGGSFNIAEGLALFVTATTSGNSNKNTSIEINSGEFFFGDSSFFYMNNNDNENSPLINVVGGIFSGMNPSESSIIDLADEDENYFKKANVLASGYKAAQSSEDSNIWTVIKSDSVTE
jgi:predicted ribosomally synthesized peptide with SipW-like signal peptide